MKKTKACKLSLPKITECLEKHDEHVYTRDEQNDRAYLPYRCEQRVVSSKPVVVDLSRGYDAI